MLDNKELVKDQNFNNCPFRVTLPKVMVVDGYVNLTFSLLSKPGKRVDVVLDEIYLTDKLSRKYEMYCSGGCKREGVSQEEFDVDVEIEKKNFLLSDSTIVLYFISGDRRRYEICYTSKRDIGIRLAYVMGRKASESELERYEEEIETEYLPHEDDDNVKVIDVSGSDSVKINDFDDRLDKNSREIIDKYKNAVLREKYYVQNEGGRKHKLTNGELIASKQGCFTYIFEMESELNLTDDAPVRLMVGSETSTGNVLVCEGFQVIVVIDKSFGDTISQAFLGVEPWKLLEALADKLEQIGPHNDLTMKFLNEGPKLATNGTPDSIPKGQETAISSAKTNIITFLWRICWNGERFFVMDM